MDAKQMVYDKLNEMGIAYRVVEHPAVFTMQDVDELCENDGEMVCKNLFLRDAKGKRHYLVILKGEKRADLSSIQEQIGSTKLSFASAERLMRHLGLTQGSVSPFGVLNDKQAEVEVVFDRELIGCVDLGFHPNDNTATVILSFEDIQRVIRENGNEIRFVTI